MHFHLSQTAAYIPPAPPEQVFASEVQKLREDKFFPKEQLTLGKCKKAWEDDYWLYTERNYRAVRA